ncbi:MAG: hypothetical protein QXU89_05325 [Desulfurococcaceae archaeon]|uniref:Uncharacterized protein n=1 Tax=Staphylothermus marinus TaxID=2280 RepID=A0A7C4H693_STAMA
MNKKKILATIVSTTVILLTITFLNQSIIYKIKYYETREGVLIRLMNNTCEEEYRKLVNTSTKYYLIGLICLIIILGCTGLYIDENKGDDRLNNKFPILISNSMEIRNSSPFLNNTRYY